MRNAARWLLCFVLALAAPAGAAVPDLTFNTSPTHARLSVPMPDGQTVDLGYSGASCPLEPMRAVARAYATSPTVPVHISHDGYDTVTAQVPQQYFARGDHAWPLLDLGQISDEQWQAVEHWCSQHDATQDGALAALLLRAHMPPSMIAALRSDAAGGNDPAVRRWLSGWQRERLQGAPSFFYVAAPRAVATRDAAIWSLFGGLGPLDEFSLSRRLALASELGVPITAYNRTTGEFVSSKRRATLSDEQRAAVERWLAIRGRAPGALFCALTAKGPDPARNMTLAAVDEALWRRPAASGDVSIVMRSGQAWCVRPLDESDVLRFVARRVSEAASAMPLPRRHVTVAFHSSPPGALVYQRNQYLGTTDAPITLDLSSMVDDRAHRYLEVVPFHFRMEHFEDTELALQPLALERGTPVAVRLRGPLWAFAQAWARRHMGVLCLLLVLLGVALAASRLLRRTSDAVGGDTQWDALVGTVVGNYRLSGRLGHGASAVFRALPQDAQQERDAVAIKLLSVETLDDAERQALNDDIARWSEFSHPGIVELLDWGEHEPYAFVVMEWVSGFSLRAMLRQSGGHPMTLSHAVRLLRPLYVALEAAHAHDLVHRNVKPENIMVLPGERIKLLEFGLARQQITRVTRSGTIVGSFAYLAPELLEGHPPTAAADQYALGVVTYEMLAGAPPFTDAASAVLMREHLERSAQPLAALRTDLPSELCDAVMRMLALAPGDRFGSVNEAWKAFERAALRGVEPA
jgi:serine/threonine-protein kinase